MRRFYILIRWGLAGALCLAVLMYGSDARGGDVPASTDVANACLVDTHERLLKDEHGRLIYVHARAFTSQGDSALLLGYPNFLTTVEDGRTIALAEDSILGVQISEGSALLITPPYPDMGNTTVRAAPRDGGGWHILMAQDSAGLATARKVWSGEYVDGQWQNVSELPVPQDGYLLSRSSSRLVKRGDSLYWAATGEEKDGTRSIIFFEKTASEWHRTHISTFHASAELASTEDGLVMLVVQPDSSLRSDGNSLFIWRRTPSWVPSRRLALSGEDGAVYFPNYRPLTDGGVVTWETQTRATGRPTTPVVARWLNATDSITRSEVIDSLYVWDGNDLLPPVASDTLTVWVTADENGNLNTIAARNDDVMTIHRQGTPYLGFMSSVALLHDVVMTTGLHHLESRRAVSLLRYARIRCGPV